MTGKLIQALQEISRKFDQTERVLTLRLLGQYQFLFLIGAVRAARTAGLFMLHERLRSGLYPLQAPLQFVALVVSFLEIGFELLHFGAKLADDLVVFRSMRMWRRGLRRRGAFPPGQVLL